MKTIKKTAKLQLAAEQHQHPEVENAVIGDVSDINRKQDGRIVASIDVPAYNTQFKIEIGRLSTGFNSYVPAQEEHSYTAFQVPFYEISGVNEINEASQLIGKQLPVRRKDGGLFFVVEDDSTIYKDDNDSTSTKYKKLYRLLLLGPMFFLFFFLLFSDISPLIIILAIVYLYF
jgi:hypothetical protein